MGNGSSRRDHDRSGLASATSIRAASALLRNVTTQDMVCLLFHGYMLARITIAPNSADASFAGRSALVLFMVSLSTVLVVRGEILRPGRMRALVYRVGLFTPMLLSYFEMRYLLPALQPVFLDSELLAIDQAIFVVTPAVWLERFNEAATVEWFAFFYWSYFAILAAMFVPALFLDRGRRLIELMVGGLVIAGLGHVGYTLVPGLGPYATLVFDGPIHDAFWWRMVQKAVHGAGAMMDIFPSLHTAYPTFFALHAFGHRDRAPFKYLWPVLAFFAANIIVATMFLRWHYGIDVIFGLMLAVTARRVSVWVSSHEAHRADESRQAVWEPLFPFQDRS